MLQSYHYNSRIENKQYDHVRSLLDTGFPFYDITQLESLVSGSSQIILDLKGNHIALCGYLHHLFPIIENFTDDELRALHGTFYAVASPLRSDSRQLVEKSISYIDKLLSCGWVLGSNSVNCNPTTKFNDYITELSRDKLYGELVESKILLERASGRGIFSFASPMYKYSSTLMYAAQRAGYISVVADGLIRIMVSDFDSDKYDLVKIPFTSYEQQFLGLSF